MKERRMGARRGGIAFVGRDILDAGHGRRGVAEAMGKVTFA